MRPDIYRFFALLLCLTTLLLGTIRIPGPGGPPAAGGGPAFPTPSSYWPLDEGTGTTFADAIGGVTCTLGGGGTGAVGLPDWVTPGLDFVAANDDGAGCGEPYPINTDTTAMSWSYAFAADDVNADQIVWGRSSSGNGYLTLLGSPQNARVAVRIEAGADTTNLLINNTTPSPTIVVGTWYHVCAAFPASPNASNSELYINGALAAEVVTNDTLTGPPTYSASNGFNFGSNDVGGNNYDGTLAVPRFWSGTELTAEHCAAVCNTDKTYLAGLGVTLTCP